MSGWTHSRVLCATTFSVTECYPTVRDTPQIVSLKLTGPGALRLFQRVKGKTHQDQKDPNPSISTFANALEITGLPRGSALLKHCQQNPQRSPLRCHLREIVTVLQLVKVLKKNPSTKGDLKMFPFLWKVFLCINLLI